MEAEEEWIMLLMAIETFDMASNLRFIKLKTMGTLDF